MRTTTIRTVPITDDVPIQIAPASPERVRFELRRCGDADATVSIGPTPPLSLNHGVTFVTRELRADPLVIDYRTHGELVRSAWYVIGETDGFTNAITVVETFQKLPHFLRGNTAYTSTIRIVPIQDSVPVTLAPAAQNRVRIETNFAGKTSGAMSIGPTPQTRPDQGITMKSIAQRFDKIVFDTRRHGDIVKSAWYGFPHCIWNPPGQSAAVAVIETFRS